MYIYIACENKERRAVLTFGISIDNGIKAIQVMTISPTPNDTKCRGFLEKSKNELMKCKLRKSRC